MKLNGAVPVERYRIVSRSSMRRARVDQIADKRVERSKAAVLAETYRQLTQSGINGVSIDVISRVSGVSKATIYRHWPSRSALLIDACSRLGNTPPPPDTGTLRTDLHVLVTKLAEQLQSAAWASVYPSIVDATRKFLRCRPACISLSWHRSRLSSNERRTGVKCSRTSQSPT